MNGKFPVTFLWGSSTNAQQFEGAAQEGNKGVSIADVRKNGDASGFGEAPKAKFEDFKIASDHYHHLEEDIDLYGEMGFGIYRFSMSWSRIFPNGDDEKPNQEGLDFYDRMITALERNHIQIVCTLYAYDLPKALVDKYDGWKDRQIIKDYCRYVDVITKYFKGRIEYYVPFNEQNTAVMIPEYITGSHITDKTSLFKMDHHFNLAYAKAVAIIHTNDPVAKTGGNICNTCVYPKTCHPKDVEAADKAAFMMGYNYADIYARGKYTPMYLASFEGVEVDGIIKEGDMEAITSVKPDFLSLTYYMSTVAERDNDGGNTLNLLGGINPYVDQTEWGWNIDPYGFCHYLMDFYHRYQLPILVLENGIGHRDTLEENGKIHDDYRIEYLRNHILQMKKAVGYGVEMIGYCTWSATDLYSTHEGFEKRYGFVYVDKKELKRFKKDSFYWYKKVIESNGELI